MFMSVKDRVKLAVKGDREARGILIRDANKMVATAVMHNPRITDHEVESISAMRQVAEEVLRLIGMNRQWARSYPIIHNLARNPRTPMATAVQILPRIRTKDLKSIAMNRNVSEAVRRQAYRLVRDAQALTCFVKSTIPGRACHRDVTISLKFSLTLDDCGCSFRLARTCRCLKIRGFKGSRSFEDGRELLKQMRQLFFFSAADFIPPSIESTTFEVRDRP